MTEWKRNIKYNQREVRLLLKDGATKRAQPSILDAFKKITHAEAVNKVQREIDVGREQIAREIHRNAHDPPFHPHEPLIRSWDSYNDKRNLVARKIFGDLFRIERLDEERISSEVDRWLDTNQVGHPSLLNTRVYFPCEPLPNDDLVNVSESLMKIINDPRGDDELDQEERDKRTAARNTLMIEQCCVGLLVPCEKDPASPEFFDQYQYVYRKNSGIYFPLTPEMMRWLVIEPIKPKLAKLGIGAPNECIKVKLKSEKFERMVPLLPPTKLLGKPLYQRFKLINYLPKASDYTKTPEVSDNGSGGVDDDEPHQMDRSNNLQPTEVESSSQQIKEAVSSPSSPQTTEVDIPTEVSSEEQVPTKPGPIEVSDSESTSEPEPISSESLNIETTSSSKMPRKTSNKNTKKTSNAAKYFIDDTAGISGDEKDHEDDYDGDDYVNSSDEDFLNDGDPHSGASSCSDSDIEDWAASNRIYKPKKTPPKPIEVKDDGSDDALPSEDNDGLEEKVLKTSTFVKIQTPKRLSKKIIEVDSESDDDFYDAVIGCESEIETEHPSKPSLIGAGAAILSESEAEQDVSVDDMDIDDEYLDDPVDTDSFAVLPHGNVTDLAEINPEEEEEEKERDNLEKQSADDNRVRVEVIGNSSTNQEPQKEREKSAGKNATFCPGAKIHSPPTEDIKESKIISDSSLQSIEEHLKVISKPLATRKRRITFNIASINSRRRSIRLPIYKMTEDPVTKTKTVVKANAPIKTKKKVVVKKKVNDASDKSTSATTKATGTKKVMVKKKPIATKDAKSTDNKKVVVKKRVVKKKVVQKKTPDVGSKRKRDESSESSGNSEAPSKKHKGSDFDVETYSDEIVQSIEEASKKIPSDDTHPLATMDRASAAVYLRRMMIGIADNVRFNVYDGIDDKHCSRHMTSEQRSAFRDEIAKFASYYLDGSIESLNEK